MSRWQVAGGRCQHEEWACSCLLLLPPATCHLPPEPLDTVRNGAKRCEIYGRFGILLELVPNWSRCFLGIVLAPKETGASLLSLPCALNA